MTDTIAAAIPPLRVWIVSWREPGGDDDERMKSFDAREPALAFALGVTQRLHGDDNPSTVEVWQSDRIARSSQVGRAVTPPVMEPVQASDQPTPGRQTTWLVHWRGPVAGQDKQSLFMDQVMQCRSEPEARRFSADKAKSLALNVNGLRNTLVNVWRAELLGVASVEFTRHDKWQEGGLA